MIIRTNEAKFRSYFWDNTDLSSEAVEWIIDLYNRDIEAGREPKTLKEISREYFEYKNKQEFLEDIGADSMYEAEQSEIVYELPNGRILTRN